MNKRREAVLVWAFLLILSPFVGDGRVVTQAAQEPAALKLTLDGDVALWTVAVRPDKTADFEKILAQLQQGLMKSEKAERKQQAAGWRVMKVAKPMPDGNVVYVHLINPVVHGADYTVMQIL